MVLVGPLLTGVILILTDPDVYQTNDILIGWLYSVPVALILCIPSWFLLGLTVTALSKNVKIAAVKIILTLLGIIYILIAFALLNYRTIIHSNYWPDLIPHMAGYYIVLITGIWLYKLDNKNIVPGVANLESNN